MRECHFCQGTYERGMNAPHWTGDEYVRVTVCGESACRDAIAKAPRKPRKPRNVEPVRVDGGGWAAWGRAYTEASKKS